MLKAGIKIMLNIDPKTNDFKDLDLSELYHKDYYTWAMTNAKLLKEGRLDEIDHINLAEEVKDLGNSEYHRLESFLANLLSHLYKWDNKPELRSKSWKNTIVNSTRGIAEVLSENPGLKYEYTFNNIFKAAWIEAQYIISNDMDINIDLIPDICHYSFKKAVKKACQPPTP